MKYLPLILLLSGCAHLEQFVEEHPRTVAATGVVVLAVGGILVARSMAHENHSVILKPRPRECAGVTYAECVR